MLRSKQNNYKQNSSDRQQRLIFYGDSNSVSYQQKSMHPPSRSSIFNEQKVFVKENISRLKTLLSQKKQINRKNRLELSPDMRNSMTSQRMDKQNKYSPSKGVIYHQSNNKSIDYPNNKSREASKYSSSHRSIKKESDTLINDIKVKIKGSSILKSIKVSEDHISRQKKYPDSVFLYEDKQINTNKNVYALVEQNQNLNSQIDQYKEQIKWQNHKIHELESKLQKLLHLTQQNQQKHHDVVSQKDHQIKNSNSAFQRQKIQLCIKLQTFLKKISDQMHLVARKITLQLNRYSNRLDHMTNQHLNRAAQKIRLEKFIFVNEKSYRKSKNYLQKSPSVKGDTFEELEQQRHELEKQDIQRQIQYHNNKHQETLIYYQFKYDQLYADFRQMQRKNDLLSQQLSFLKDKQSLMIAQKLERQKEEKQRQKTPPKRQAYLKRQVSPLSLMPSPRLTRVNKNIVQTSSIASQATLDNRNLFKGGQSILTKSWNEINGQRLNGHRINNDQRINHDQRISNDWRLNNDQRLNNDKKNSDSFIKIKQVEQENIVRSQQKLLQQKETRQKQLQQKAQKQLEEKMAQEKIAQEKIAQEKIVQEKASQERAIQQEQARMRQLYSEELQHIKNMLKSVEQTTPKPNLTQIDDALQNQPPNFKQKKGFKSPIKMKEISKIEGIAKKQKIQKQKYQIQLQTIERQLSYERKKNLQLQSLIDQKQEKIFTQAKQRNIKYAFSDLCQQEDDEESLIHEEQHPFSHMLPSLNRSKTGELEQSSSLQWQIRVRDRLENTIQRLQTLQNKYSNKASIRDANQRSIQDQQQMQ